MQSRRLTPLDRLLSSANNALRTVVASSDVSARANPAKDIDAAHDAALDAREKAHAAGLMRVNHAGEIAAQALYQGHATVVRDKTIGAQMQQAADEELDHLAWCEQRLDELGERPSRLAPIWYAGAYAIGAVSGLLGDKWSLGFIAETEAQVCAHLENHLKRLPANDKKSRAIVAQMRDEEAVHREHALRAGGAQLPRPVTRLMRLSAKMMTRTAYWL
jgi:ubiquinone biosynthesis monooxygenase Coq7